MKLVITIDVEEEGLFSGRYPRVPPGVENVAALHSLEFVTRDFGFPLTLLPTYPVARDRRCREVLSRWQKLYGAEIGSHLHPWNTPPFADHPLPEPMKSDLLPMDLLSAKLETLLATIEEGTGVRPRSFRMGRFDLGRRIAELLPRYGVTVDSSIVPLRCVAGGPDHFLAPVDPYFPAMSSSDRRLLEVPLTLVSIFPGLPERLYGMAATLRPRKTDFLLNAFRYAAVVGIQPAWFPLESMKTAVRLHRRRGGRVLAMFLHSSELYPGASPKFRTKAAVDRLLDKLRAFLNWLVRTVPVDGVVLSGLHPCLAAAGEKRPDAVEADRR